MPDPSYPLLYPFHGVYEEKRTRSSYYWDSSRRGMEPFVILQLTHSGWGIFEEKGRKQEVPAGHAFVTVVPEKASYYYPEGAKEPWTFSWLNFRGEEGIRLWLWFRQRFGSVFPMEKQSGARLIYEDLLALTNGKKRADDFQASAESYRLLMALASQLEAGSSDPVSAVREAARSMELQPGRSMAVKEFAARAGLSREHFSRLFRREIGRTPAAFRRACQLDRAAEWLKRTDLSVQEISLRLGFSSGRQLTKMFRFFRGQTPLEFRRKTIRAKK